MSFISNYIDFLKSHASSIREYTLQHLSMSLTAVILGIIVTLPLGIYLAKTKSKFIRSLIFGITNIFQTIPTIALLAIMIPLFGIGAKPAILALFLYSLLPLLRNTFTGIQSVDPAVIESGRGMGYNARQLLFKIEIPLAFPYIMSGIRVTTVYVISWTTLAAVVGAGGLGELVISGISFNSKNLIFTGTIMAILLASISDIILGFVERKLFKK